MNVVVAADIIMTTKNITNITIMTNADADVGIITITMKKMSMKAITTGNITIIMMAKNVAVVAAITTMMKKNIMNTIMYQNMWMAM